GQRTTRFHTGGLRSVFSEAHVPGKNRFQFFPACGRKTLPRAFVNARSSRLPAWSLAFPMTISEGTPCVPSRCFLSMDNTKRKREGEKQMKQTKSDTVFQWKGIPPTGQLIPLGLQHVVATVVGIITTAILISNTCSLSEEQKSLMIQVSLILTALATLLQLFPIFGRIGAGLPVIMGISFAYIPTLQAIGAEFGIATILGAEIIGGCVAIVFGIF